MTKTPDDLELFFSWGFGVVVVTCGVVEFLDVLVVKRVALPAAVGVFVELFGFFERSWWLWRVFLGGLTIGLLVVDFCEGGIFPAGRFFCKYFRLFFSSYESLIIFEHLLQVWIHLYFSFHSTMSHPLRLWTIWENRSRQQRLRQMLKYREFQAS